MKRSRPWLTMVVTFSRPVLVFAQATGGSTDTKIIKNGATRTTGKKGTAHKELARKGSGNAPNTTGNTTAPKVETQIGSATGGAGAGKISHTDTGRKGKVEPTMSARKKPPRPAPKPPDQK